jgi:PAS domain S-box-containing protein
MNSENGEQGRPDIFKRAVETMPTAVIIYDSDGAIQYVNPEYTELTHQPDSRLRDRRIWEIDSQLTEQTFAEYWDSFSDSETRRIETEHCFEQTNKSVTATITQTQISETAYHVGTVRDLSQQRVDTRRLQRQNERLKQQNEKLKQQNEQLESFASIVSHDLRNPLTVAKGYLTAVRDKRSDEDLARIADALDRMEALIDDLLQLAREGTLVDDIESVSVAEITRAAWTNVQTANAELSVEEGRIYADPDRVQQLFENLFRNSVEHGGQDVSVRVETLDSIGTSTRVDSEFAAGFAVADDGPGIPTDKREAVFADGYSTAEDGTGLGLSAVKEIATAHGWKIRCTESVAGGAQFEFTGTKKQDADHE